MPVVICAIIVILIGITANDIYKSVNKNDETIPRVAIVPENYKTQTSVHGISYSYPDYMTVISSTEEYEGQTVDIELVGYQNETQFVAEFMVYPMDNSLNIGFEHPFFIDTFGKFIKNVDNVEVEKVNGMTVMHLEVNQEGVQSTYVIQDSNKNIIAFSFLEHEDMDYNERDLLIKNVLGSIKL